ncbi:MAG: hypothetical protein LHV69_03820 [Elusimicrobia bacterium]|nr:hypothetical protein [Candidatus Obscuribacterium magneticum]
MILYLIQTSFTIFLLFFFLPPASGQEPKVIPAYDTQKIKPPPKRPVSTADIQIEWQEPSDLCPTEKLCVEGQLFNAGPKPAYKIYLVVEIGGTTLTKPKAVVKAQLEESAMNPGDRQLFSIQLDRKIPYKERGQDYIIEVGKFNYKIKAKWSDTLPKKRKKKV